MPRKISVEIVGDSRSLERAFDRSAKSARGFNRSVSQAGRSRRVFGGLTRSVTGLAGAFIGGYGLASAARAAFEEMGNAQKVNAQTRAALKSTGRVANVTAKHVDTLATSLMNLSGEDDEAIKSSENLLLTFTNIRNEVGKNNDIFDQATRAALDMSVALKEDLGSASIQLGKALNDPVKGITALRRVGVSFTEDQQKLIKRLVETGHTLEAQKLILHELNREFGGSAEAAGKTLPQRLKLLQNQLLNLGGAIAQTLSPAITALINKMIKWLQNTKNQKQVLDTVKQVAQAVAGVLRVLGAVLRTLNSITGSTKNTLYALFVVLAGFKTLQLVATFRNMAIGLGLIGTSASRAVVSARLLRTSLLALRTIGPIAIAVELILHKKQVESFFDRHLGFHIDPLGHYVKKGVQAVFGGGGTPRPSGPSKMLAPGAARAGAALYTGPINVYGVQNPAQFENDLAKRHRARAHHRRGAR